MNYKIYVSNNNFLYFYKNYFIHLFTLLNIKYEFVNNYDNEIDFVISAKNDIFKNNEKLYNNFLKNITIMNNIEYNYLLMNKDIIIDLKSTPYTFNINFNNLYYNKKKMKEKINNYKYNKYFGNKYWILKNTKSGRGIGTLLVTTDELLLLETNKRFINEISNFKNKKTSYIIQKYLENPVIYDNKKYDIRVHILLLTKLDKNIINYKFYLYKEIIARLTTKNFNLYDKDKKSHLTNMAVQNELNTYNFKDFVDNEIYDKVYKNIYIQVKELLLSDKFINILKNINKYPYCYDIIGLDVLLDNDYNTYIIDLNVNPSIKSNIFNKDVLYPFDNYNESNINMIECILFRIIKLYNNKKKFIIDDNINIFKKLEKKYKFKRNFKYLLKITNNK